MNSMLVDASGVTDRGVVRSDNQDQFFVAELTRCMRTIGSSLTVEPNAQLKGSPLGYLFMVADGMGGHRAGNEASGLAIQYFIASILNRVRWLTPKTDADESLLIEDLKVMLNQAHQEIKRQSESSESLAGMGTTFTMAYVIWPRMYVVHAGDTRCYLFRRDELKLLTRDHTVAEQMMKSGRLAPEAMERSPWSNVLLNALGAGADDVFAEITMLELQEGDLVLLCSDGLNKHVDDTNILNAIRQYRQPQTLCQTLVQQANQGGGSDNITVVAATWRRSHSSHSMPIYHTKPIESVLLREIATPSDEFDTTDHETLRISTCEFNDHPTDPMIGGS
jgi:protein phosphatase